MKTRVIIQNLKCGGCAKTITLKLSQLKNISEVTVDKDTSSVSFISKAEDDALIVNHTLKELGYPSIGSENTMLLKAKSYVSCASGKISK